MHATLLSYPLPLAHRAAFVSFLTQYSRIAVLRPSGSGLLVLLVRQSTTEHSTTISHIALILCLDAPCKVEEIPAVDAIVLSVSFPHPDTPSKDSYAFISITTMTSAYVPFTFLSLRVL